MSSDAKFTIMTTPDVRDSAEHVVTQLIDVYKKLAITEANIELLAKMVKSSIGTNDVRNFVCNQSGLRRINKSLDKKSIKRLMRKKFSRERKKMRIVRGISLLMIKKILLQWNKLVGSGRRKKLKKKTMKSKLFTRQQRGLQ